MMNRLALGLICVVMVFAATTKNACGQIYPPVSKITPVFKAGPYMDAVGSTAKYRLKMVIIRFNPDTTQMSSHSYIGPSSTLPEAQNGIPPFTTTQSVPIPPMNYSYLTTSLDGAVTNAEAVAVYNNQFKIYAYGIVQRSAGIFDPWLDYATIPVAFDLLPPVNP